MRLQAAQLVELRAVAVRDDAAVDDARGGLHVKRSCKKVEAVLGSREVLQKLLQKNRALTPIQSFAEIRQQAQALAQPGQLARARALQRHARRDALDVREAAQQRVDFGKTLFKRRNGIVPHRKRAAVAQRMVQPVAQAPAAHAGGALIEQREQRRRRLAAQRLGELEVAPRRRIEAQVLATALGGKRRNVRERLALCPRCVLEQRAAGADRKRQVLAAEAGQRSGAELLQQPFAARVDIELPRRQAGGEIAFETFLLIEQDFRRPDASELVVERLGGDLGDAQRAARE